MEVITIDSEAFQSLKEQLNRIESYIERTIRFSWELNVIRLKFLQCQRKKL